MTENAEAATWRLGDEKDGMPAMVRWPVTDGWKRFTLFSYEEAEELKATLNALEARVVAAEAERDALATMAYENGLAAKRDYERAEQAEARADALQAKAKMLEREIEESHELRRAVNQRASRAEAKAALTLLNEPEFQAEVAVRLGLTPNSIGVNRLMRCVRDAASARPDALTSSTPERTEE